MADKILNTRILMKVDTLENWSSSTLPLKKGELAFATVAASAGTGLTEPVVMVKIGEDGVKTFKDLEWNFYAKASDVLAACKDEAALRTFINGVIADAGIATSEAMEALAGKVTAAEGEIDTLQSEMDAVEGKAAANESAITALEGLVGEKAVATQISEAIAALDLANTYDAKGAAAAAEAAAKGHADSLNTAMDTRVKAVEAKAHEHANAAELDKIAEGDVAKWNAAEQNAKDYADGLNTAMDARVDDLEAMFGNGEGTVESQIEAAVAAETEAREEAIAGLQEQITANDGDISALQTLVGDTAVATQISTAVAAEAEIARAAEKANADDIDALEGRVAANEGAIATLNGNSSVDGSVDKKIADAINEFATQMSDDDTVNTYKELINYAASHGSEFTELVGEVDANAKAIETLNGDASTAGSVDKKIADAISAENLAQYATDEELTALTGRVTTAEGKITTLEGEMDTAQADIDALEAKVGDKTVATQISEAVNGLKTGELATMQGEIDAVEDRATALEAKAHEHANKSVLDGIEAADITAWDAKVDDVTAAADSGLKATRTGNTVAIEIDESVTFIFDCGTSAV